jgi:Mg2+ and Co2+ transporter CorA
VPRLAIDVSMFAIAIMREGIEYELERIEEQIHAAQLTRDQLRVAGRSTKRTDDYLATLRPSAEELQAAWDELDNEALYEGG